MYDIAIIGGGPAVSPAVALLVRAGRGVVLFERENFPRFHIGESLLPFSMNAFTRLGLHEKFLSAGFIKKYGGEIRGACSETGTKFYFKDGYRSQTDHAYQVTRGDFDKVLLDHAAECGAEVHEQLQLIESSSRKRTLSLESDPTVRLIQSGRVTSSTPAGAPRFWAGNSKSKRPTIIFRSYLSSRTTMVSGARKELTARSQS